MAGARKSPLGLGEAAPWFRCATLERQRPICLRFRRRAGDPDAVLRQRGQSGGRGGAGGDGAAGDLFDDDNAAFFGITVDPADAAEKRIRKRIPGIRFFLDYDRAVSRAYGAADDGAVHAYRGHWLLLDRALRVRGQFRLTDGAAALDALAALAGQPPLPDWAPVVAVPDVFEPALCRRLIDLYEADGGEDSGFMRDVGGMTKLLVDPRHKVRRDYLIEDPELARQLNLRIIHRLLPMVKRAFQYEATRVERLLVGCYEAETGGHFRAHRDDTAQGHRPSPLRGDDQPQCRGL